MKSRVTNPIDQPAYTVAEAARYLKLPAATLRSWTSGRAYPKGNGVAHFRPLIHPPQKQPPLLSFSNLIEAHVLRALRTEHGISIQAVRKALSYAERKLDINLLLLREELMTGAGQVFLERYGKLIELTASGQLAMRHLLETHLKRVEWGELDFPVRLYPFLSSGPVTADKSIAIDPSIAFGRPIILRAGVSTAIISERLDASESIDDLATDYGLTPAEIEQAVLFERAA